MEDGGWLEDGNCWGEGDIELLLLFLGIVGIVGAILHFMDENRRRHPLEDVVEE